MYFPPFNRQAATRLLAATLLVALTAMLCWPAPTAVAATRFIQRSESQTTLPTLNYDIALGGDIDGALRTIFPSTGKAAFGLERYLNRLVKAMAPEAPFYYPYSATVLEENRFAIAVSTPGGFMYFSEALLHLTETESQLAALLATQMAHINRRHMFELPQVVDTTLQSTFFQGERDADTFAGMSNRQKTAYRWAHTLIYQSYLESEMLDALRLATDIMVDSGYDPTGMSDWLNKLVALQDQGVVTDYLQNNPINRAMVFQIEEYIAQRYPDGAASAAVRGRQFEPDAAGRTVQLGRNRDIPSSRQSFRAYRPNPNRGMTPVGAANQDPDTLPADAQGILDTQRFHDIMD